MSITPYKLNEYVRFKLDNGYEAIGKVFISMLRKNVYLVRHQDPNDDQMIIGTVMHHNALSPLSAEEQLLLQLKEPW